MAKTASKTESGILGTVHKTAAGLHRAGVIDKATMREFDVRCLTTLDKLTAKDIQKLRKREGISQAVLALCLNVTTNYVSQIERGAKRPRGATLKLLSLIRQKGLEAVL